jgi:hypothetical protein
MKESYGGVAFAPGRGAPVSDEVAASELLGRVAARYAEIGSYRDTGVVRQDDTVVVRFCTAFRRSSGAFRFEFARDRLRGLVRRDGGVMHSRYEPKRDEYDEDDFLSAIAGAGGQSMGAASTIPALLLPEEVDEYWILPELRTPRIIAPPLDAARSWIWVGGDGWSGQAMRVGIDPATLLVRRIDDAGNSRVPPSVMEYDAEADMTIGTDEVASAAFGRFGSP